MIDVFVSYKREDDAGVRPLVAVLASEGFTVWWDQNMLPGERIPTIVRKILDEASCVVVVWSARSSESNWVSDEATYGRDHNMLIPVSLDGTPPPLGFQQLLTQ